MVKEAEENADADKQRKELVDARNQGEAMVHSVRKTLEENKDLVGDDEKSNIESAAKELEDLLEKDDAKLEDIKEKTDALTQASMKLGEAIYAKQQAESAQAESSETEAKADDNVVDAEFEEVKEDSKDEKSA